MTDESAAMAPPARRVDPPYVAAERQALEAWLDYHRETLLWKCEGLTDDQLRLRSATPSNLSLLGLVASFAMFLVEVRVATRSLRIGGKIRR